VWRDRVGLEEFADLADGDELCRRLLRPGACHGSSTRHQEAVDLLQSVVGSGELGEGLIALLLCTCRRWDRVTGRLVAGIEASGSVSEPELDELAETFLGDEVGIVYPLAWVSPEWLEIDLSDPRMMVVCDGAPGLNNAIEQLWPGADRQRCTVHRLRNLLAKLPDDHHELVRSRYWQALDEATGQRDGEHRLRELVGWLADQGFASAAACLADDLEALCVHLRYPLNGISI